MIVRTLDSNLFAYERPIFVSNEPILREAVVHFIYDVLSHLLFLLWQITSTNDSYNHFIFQWHQEVTHFLSCFFPGCCESPVNIKQDKSSALCSWELTFPEQRHSSLCSPSPTRICYVPIFEISNPQVIAQNNQQLINEVVMQNLINQSNWFFDQDLSIIRKFRHKDFLFKIILDIDHEVQHHPSYQIIILTGKYHMEIRTFNTKKKTSYVKKTTMCILNNRRSAIMKISCSSWSWQKLI